MRKAPMITTLCVFLLMAASPAYSSEIEITGRVVDSADNGLAGVRVDFLDADAQDGEFAATAFTGDHGYFTAVLEPGDYKVTVTKSLSEVASFSVTVDDENGMSPNVLKADF